jgi:hypothetical protein
MAEAVVTAKKGKINSGLRNVFKIPSSHDVHSRRLYFRVSYASFTVVVLRFERVLNAIHCGLLVAEDARFSSIPALGSEARIPLKE